MGYDTFRNLTTVAVGDQNLVIYDYKNATNRLSVKQQGSVAFVNTPCFRLFLSFFICQRILRHGFFHLFVTDVGVDLGGVELLVTEYFL